MKRSSLHWCASTPRVITSFWLFFTTTFAFAYPESSPREISRIAFGSCAKQDRPQPLWDEISKTNPDLFLMIGDNIYADTADAKVFKEKYQQLADIPSFKNFAAKHPILATWDDHDYGANDGGAEFSGKEVAKQAFVNFWGIPSTSSMRSHPGLYHSVSYGPLGRQVQIILLDSRTFRGPLSKDARGYRPHLDPTSSMLGEEQWAWLETQLKHPADVRIIVSSIQMIPEDHVFEKWSNLPLERKKLLKLIQSTKAKGVIFISGDRHHGEISKLPKAQSESYDLYDLTSSGMTEKGRGFREEKNQWRIGSDKAFFGNQYGEIKIRWDAKPGPIIDLTLKDEKNQTIATVQTSLNDLK